MATTEGMAFFKQMILLCLLNLGVSLSLSGQPNQESAYSGSWYRRISLTAAAGSSSNGILKKGPGAELAIGRHLSEKIQIGVAGGLEWLGNRPYQRFAPAVVEGAWLLRTGQRWSPYVLGSLGYGFAWKDAGGVYRSVRGGSRWNVQAGITRKLGGHHQLLADFGLLEQHAEAKRDNFWWWGGQDNYVHESFRLHRWRLRLGWVF